MESRADMTDRLRREGRWQEASQFRQAIIRECRARGLRKAQARDYAWQETARAYPPAGAEDPSDVPVGELNEWYSGDGGCLDRIADWRRDHAITLTDDALRDLVLLVASSATAWPEGDSDQGWGLVYDWTQRLTVADLDEPQPADSSNGANEGQSEPRE